MYVNQVDPRLDKALSLTHVNSSILACDTWQSLSPLPSASRKLNVPALRSSMRKWILGMCGLYLGYCMIFFAYNQQMKYRNDSLGSVFFVTLCLYSSTSYSHYICDPRTSSHYFTPCLSSFLKSVNEVSLGMDFNLSGQSATFPFESVSRIHSNILCQNTRISEEEEEEEDSS